MTAIRTSADVVAVDTVASCSGSSSSKLAPAMDESDGAMLCVASATNQLVAERVRPSGVRGRTNIRQEGRGRRLPFGDAGRC